MNPTITNFLISIIGYFLIWVAVDYKRTPECKVNLFSKAGLIQFLLITAGTVIITNC